MKNFIAVSLISILLIGCLQQYTIKSNFNESEAQNALKQGKNTVRGSALIRQNIGNVVTCAGTQVSLIPVNEYSNERIFYLYKNTQKGFIGSIFANQTPFANDNPAYHRAMINTICNAQGFFTIENVSDGEFFVIARVMWRVGYSTEGGMLMRKVSVRNGENVEIVLSP